MKQTLAFTLWAVACLTAARAGETKIDAVMMTEPGGRSIAAYTADASNLYAVFKSEGLKAGDKIRGVLIADDVGDAAPQNTKVLEKTLAMEGEMNAGEFKFMKPTNGWPTGKYHVEIYLNDELATKVAFEIKTAGKSKKADEEEDESGD